LDGERVLSAEEFFLSYLTTSLDPAEMIIEIELPTMSPKMGWSFMEQSLRRGDFALAGAGVTVELKDDLETCMVARIVFIGVDDKPVRGTLIEECLLGRPMNDLAIEEAGELVENIIDPESDIHAGVEYRLNLSKVILKRALKEAKKRAQEKASP
jgi:CO/xanthine dehydrogenase FAD-binding subunit